MNAEGVGVAADPRVLVHHLERDLARAAEPFRAASILVIDDEPMNVDLLERLLRMAGTQTVHKLTDARQAVEICLSVRPDLIMLDLLMPHVDGYEVLAALQHALSTDEFLPVLVLSGDTSPEARERALDAGAKDFVTKPFNRVEVLQRVETLLETRALYQGVRRQNELLQAELDQQGDETRRRDQELSRTRRRIETVLAEQAFHVVFQPIVDLRGRRLVGVEALTRFTSEPTQPPNVWFDDAARVGLGVELELAVISAALEQLDRVPPDAMLSVNVSPATAVSPALADILGGAARGRVVAELTEHARIDDYEHLLKALEGLRGRGILIAVDDAGAGYSGLQQILKLRPDVIKLDIELTRGIDQDPVRRALASSLVRFSEETSAVLVAEGIETEGELSTLQQLGVRWGQGFFLARPGPLSSVTQDY